MSKYEIVTYQGRKLDRYTLAAIKAAERLLRYTPGALTIVQGSYNRGGVAQSAGTHDGGGALDVTANDISKKVAAFRRVGIIMSDRLASSSWSRHGHGVQDGNEELSSGAAAQVREIKAGGDGLIGTARDAGSPRFDDGKWPVLVYGGYVGDWYVQTDGTKVYDQPSTQSRVVGTLNRGDKVTGVAVVKVQDSKRVVNEHGNYLVMGDLIKARYWDVEPPEPVKAPTPYNVATFNVADKLSPFASRFDDIVEEIRLSAADIVGLQECGPDSSTAIEIARLLGGGWKRLPTVRDGHNENEIIYDSWIWARKNMGVFVIPGGPAGRKHVTWGDFRHLKTKGDLVFGDSHFEYQSGADNDLIREQQAAAMVAGLRAVAGGKVVIVGGDFNTAKVLSGFTKAGLRYAKTAAAKTSHTLVNTLNKGQIRVIQESVQIDGFYVDERAAVAFWEVVGRFDGEGNYADLHGDAFEFASDHQPVAANGTFPTA